MHPFWAETIGPLLEAADARTVVEVGAEAGRTTRLLLERAARVGGVVHAIDPAPRFDVSPVELKQGPRFRFHRARSVDVLGRIGGVDAALIDGDHNWHTVHSELGLLAERAAADRKPMPLVIAHDVGWPYGRRDMYYDPRSLPDGARQDAARAGIRPGQSELGADGINADYWNATREGGPRNGVLTAIEDFVGEQPGTAPELIVIDGWHGLGVLATAERIAANPALGPALARLRSPEYLREQLRRIEAARIAAGMRAAGGSGSAPAEGPQGDATRDHGLLDEQD